MNLVVVRTTEFKSKPLHAEEANREFQLFCEAVQSDPDATSHQPSLTFAEYLQSLQDTKVAHR